jgi:multiple sugar transport system substrate-binding protein
MLKAITYCRDLIYRHKVHPPPVVRIDETESFITGKISMTVAGVWNIRSYNRSESQWDIARVPVDVKGRPHHAWAAGMGHCIYAQTRYPEKAWRLVKFLSSHTGQRALARSGTSVPVLRSAAFSEDFLAPFDRPPRSSYHVIFDSLSGPPSPGKHSKGYIEYTRKRSNILDSVWRDMRSPEEACRMIDEETDAILAEQYGTTSP